MSDCEIKDGKCINPYHRHNDRQEPPHKEAASTSSIPKPDIDEILLGLVNKGSFLPRGKTISTTYTAEAKQTLYQILLEAMPVEFKWHPGRPNKETEEGWNQAVAAQRKALAELMGVKE